MARLPLETVRVLNGPQGVTPRQTARGTTFIYCKAGSIDLVSGYGEVNFDVTLDASSTCAIICSFSIHTTAHGEDPADMKFSVLVAGGSGNQQDNFHAYVTEYPGSPAAYYNATINEVVTREGTLGMVITANFIPDNTTVTYHCTAILGVDTGAECVEYSNPV